MRVYPNRASECNSAATSIASSPFKTAGAVAPTTTEPRPRFTYKPGWADRIPRTLKEHPRWLLWKFVRREKADGTAKWTKMPFQARAPREPASATDPATWASFDEARAALEANAGEIDGLGFVLGRLDGPGYSTISGVDLDHCIDAEGRIAEWARIRLEDLASYAEISPSGRGVKILVHGCWADGASYAKLDGLGEDGEGQIEIARRDRFFTVTGDRVDERWTALGLSLLQGIYDWIERENRKRNGLDGRVGGRPTDAGEPLPREELAGLSPLEKFLAQLDAMGINYSSSGDRFDVCCPVHSERKASMSLRVAKDGRLLVYCFSCLASYEEIMKAVGLQSRDGFPERASNQLAVPHGRRRVPWSCHESRVAEVPRELIDNMTAEADRCEQAIRSHPEKLTELATRLGVSEDSLRRLRVGWRQWNLRRGVDGESVGYTSAWTFPEVNARGEVVGIQRRFLDDSIGKRVIRESRRGIYLPAGWRDAPGPIYLPEGASDVAALLTAGFSAIGRPNASGGVEELAALLGGVDREIVVIGERDQKADGRWPGKDFAESTARALAQRLRRRVDVKFPPQGFKDFREFITASSRCTRRL